jgi:hypothetical protein
VGLEAGIERRLGSLELLPVSRLVELRPLRGRLLIPYLGTRFSTIDRIPFALANSATRPHMHPTPQALIFQATAASSPTAPLTARAL